MISDPSTAKFMGLFFFGLILSFHLSSVPSFAGEARLKQIKLPPGFEISVFADNVGSARLTARCWCQTITAGESIASATENR